MISADAQPWGKRHHHEEASENVHVPEEKGEEEYSLEELADDLVLGSTLSISGQL